MEKKPHSPSSSIWRDYGAPLIVIAGITAIAAGFGMGLVNEKADWWSFLDSAIAWRTGEPIYTFHRFSAEANLNAPAMLLLFLPFAYLPAKTGLLIWQMVQVSCLGMATLIIRRETGVDALLIFASLGVAGGAGLQYGQVTGVLTLLIAAAWAHDRRRRDSPAAGALLGAAMYLKPFLLVFVPYLLWRRAWRACLAGSLSIAALIAVGAAAFGPSIYVAWLGSLQKLAWEAHPANVSWRGLIARSFDRNSEVTTILSHAPEAGQLVTVAILAIGSIVLVAAIVRAGNRDRAWGALIIGALLISPLGWSYYVPLAAGPLVATANDSKPRGAMIWIVAVVCFRLPAIFWPAEPLRPWLTLTYGSLSLLGTIALMIGIAISTPPIDRDRPPDALIVQA